MTIDKHAPLIAKKEIIINAPINHVWGIQSDIHNWPKWQQDISFANLEGELKKGATFTWKAVGINIISVLQEVTVNQTMSWSGDSIGMHAIHIWNFEKLGSKTKVITQESLSGWFATIIKLFKPTFLEESLDKSLTTLKLHAEKTC